MQKSYYDALARPFETNEKRKHVLLAANRVVTIAFYVIYPAMLVILLILGDPRFAQILLVPVISFILVTIFRRIVNAKRPYEVWGEQPLIEKETAGRSFPSRHVFSAFMIAMAMLWINIPAGIVLMAAGAFLAVARVIARVHFLRDVVAGALIAVGLGILGFYVF
ncbi:MAG: phosphatase PAP2 family protein [Lachnospiraceae bacterium]|nr:phosphatase PAP2 family protein [Lachnospiraceae bacterium]